MPFLIFLKSIEVLLFEIMSWIVFYPRTMWRSGRHPLQMMDRSEQEVKLPAEQQFRDVVSPPIFLLLTVIVAHAFEVAVAGNSALIDSGIGLAGLIQDNTSLIVYRLIAFASPPVIAGALALIATGRHVNRDTLQPLFYAQCFLTTPAVLLCSIAATLTRLPSAEANIPAAILVVAAIGFYIAVEATWFTREANRGPMIGFLWAVAVFALSALVVAATALLFAGI